jgi:D-glycero-alpha-D-manno-heptose 1-phosphate guanylyltransferase
MIRQAIILAGGLGTRLRSIVPDLPKCMAPVNGKPFIGYLIDYFMANGIDRFIFALGFKSGAFDGYLRDKFDGAAATYSLSIEDEPLGTGGAIRLACGQASDPTVLVANGDTFFRIDPAELAAFHARQEADCTLCLKPLRDFDRYGVVALEPGGRIKQFREKQFYAEGLINGGVYALNKERFMGLELPEKFSFEKDYLQKETAKARIDGKRGQDRPARGGLFGLVQAGYFIDIGIPADYERAQTEMKTYVI